jgi:hypothetical protein
MRQTMPLFLAANLPQLQQQFLLAVAGLFISRQIISDFLGC